VVRHRQLLYFKILKSGKLVARYGPKIKIQPNINWVHYQQIPITAVGKPGWVFMSDKQNVLAGVLAAITIVLAIVIVIAAIIYSIAR